jgi:hypothetical protein
MTVSFHNLAADLSERLTAAAPNGLSVRSAAGVIEVISKGKIVGRSPALDIIDDDDGRTLHARIETATRAALSGVQDVIVEDIHRPWPVPADGDSGLPGPDCRVTGHQLLVWFGDEATPVLAFPPITLR